MTGRPKRHHYLPQNYLEGFCRTGKIWVYDRDSDHSVEQTPVNTAVRTHYYSHEAEDGFKDPIVEEKLLAEIDGWFPPLRQVLLDGGKLGWNDRQAMAMFVALLMLRTPGFQGEVEDFETRVYEKIADVAFTDVDRTSRLLEQMERDTGWKPKTSPEELSTFHKSGKYTIRVSRNESIRLMLELFQQMAERLVGMQWFLFHITNPRKSFVTSDNPFVIYPPKGESRAGIETGGAVKMVPLHQHLMLGIGDRCDSPLDSIHVEQNDREKIRVANEVTAGHSTRFFFARDKALVERVSQSLR